MSRIFLHRIFVLFCLSGLISPNVDGQQHLSDKYVVVAIANDIQSALIRGPSGHIDLYRIGDRLRESEWRMISTSAGALELQATERLHGMAVNLRLRTGDAFDQKTLSASLQHVAEPLYRTEQMIQRKAVGSSAERN